MPVQKTCFVIAPIGEPGSAVRKRSDQVSNHIIAPSVKPFGYEPLRADTISRPGIITSQVIQRVVDSPLVIADLTGHNPNVFYELAIRHAIRKPLIQIAGINEPIPFDVAGTRTVIIDVHDLDSADKAKKEIANQIQSLEIETEIDTPISVALDLKILKESKNPEERSFADLLESMSRIMRGIDDIENRISSLEQETFRYLRKQIDAVLDALDIKIDLVSGERTSPSYTRWSELATPTTGREADRDDWIKYLAEVRAIPVWDEKLQPFPVYFRRLEPKYDITHLRGFGKKTRKRVAEILGIATKEECEEVREEVKERFGR